MDRELLSLFEDSLQRFNREYYTAAQAVARAGAQADDAPGLWAEMAALGWFELLRPPEQGGVAPLAGLLPIFRAAGEGLWREPIGTVLGESAPVICRAEDGALRERLLQGLVSGGFPLAYAAREPGDGWSRTGAATQARRHGGGYRLHGGKVGLLGAAGCAAFLVLATDAGSGAAAYFLVQRDAPGLGLDGYATVDGRALSDLRLEGAPGQRVCGGAAAEAAEGWGAILAAAEAVGMMRGANADTAAYLQQRRQFGRALIGFQALQHRLVEMHLLERETAALLQETAEAYDAAAPGMERRLLALRAQASRALRQVVREAVHLHGGIGVTQELRISHYYRRALTLDSLYGSEAWALERLAD